MDDSIASNMSQASNSGAVLWLRNDLRLMDQPLLRAGQPLPAVWLYAFDKRFLSRKVGIPGGQGHLCKASAKRALFVLQSVRTLGRRLREELGADLVCRYQAPEDAIVSLVQQLGWSSWEVHCQRELGTEEAMVEEKVQNAACASGGALSSTWGKQFLFHPDDVHAVTGVDPSAALTNPHHFWEDDGVSSHNVPVRKSTSSLTVPCGRQFVSGLEESIRDPCGLLKMTDVDALISLGYSEAEAHSACTPDPRAVLAFEGGEVAALARLDHWAKHALKDYYEERSGLLGPDYSSKLSPWLALGCVSAATVYERVLQAGDDESTRWFVSELAWRDLFRYHMLFHGEAVFCVGGPAESSRPWLQDAKLFDAWCQGKTGIPYVDAHMRELSATGFMSNTGRQLVASFLGSCLQLDWRMGAMWFEATLLDHDVALNYGNWNREAHVRWCGRGREATTEELLVEGREQLIARLTGALKGGSGAYDTAKFIRLWVPELQTESAACALRAHGKLSTVFPVLCEKCDDLDRAARLQDGHLLCATCRGCCSWCSEDLDNISTAQAESGIEITKRRRLYCSSCEESWRAQEE